MPAAIRNSHCGFRMAEIADADQRRIFDGLVARGEISVDGFTVDEVIEIVEEHSAVSGNLSIPDCSVCYFARKHNVPMLTGDRRLRRYAEEHSIEVHGILFIFDELVKHDIISTSMAADRLEELFAINARLPKAEIRERINRWKNN